MAEDYFESFIQECFDPETEWLIGKTKEYLEKHLEEIENSVFRDVDEYFKRLAQKQVNGDKPISVVQMSLLYSSVYFRKPVWRFDAYGEQLYFEDSYLSYEVKADWMFHYWQDFLDRLDRYIQQKQVGRWVHRELVQKELYKTVNILNHVVMVYLKYILRRCKKVNHYHALKKCDQFFLTYGEYLDWQRKMMAEQEAVDMFHCPQGTSTTFRVYKNEDFGLKLMKDFVLNSSEFKDCTFYGGQIQDVSFNDCEFVNCEFVGNHIQGSSFCGAVFTNCIFEDVTFENVKTGVLGLPAEEIKDFYKKTEWIGSEFRNVSFTDSNLSNVTLIDTDHNGLSIVNCSAEKSDLDFEGTKTV